MKSTQACREEDLVLGGLLQGPLTSRGPKENLRRTDQETTHVPFVITAAGTALR